MLEKILVKSLFLVSIAMVHLQGVPAILLTIKYFTDNFHDFDRRLKTPSIHLSVAVSEVVII